MSDEALAVRNKMRIAISIISLVVVATVATRFLAHARVEPSSVRAPLVGSIQEDVAPPASARTKVAEFEAPGKIWVKPDPRVLSAMSDRLKAVPGISYEVTDFGRQYPGLNLASQQGDVVATRTILKAIRACPPDLPRDLAELERAQQGIIENTAPQYRLPSESEESGMARLAALRAHCGFVPGLAYERQYDLLSLLAELGDADAKLAFPFARELIVDRSPQASAQRKTHNARAISYLESEFKKGNPASLHALARSYREGVLRPRDAVLAYAYAYAATLAPGDHSVLAESLPGHAAALSAQQLERARAMGAEFFQQCCK